MKKWTIVVPTPVFVSITVEAETEEDARMLSEDMEFGLEYGINMGGGAFAIDKAMELEVGEANFDDMTMNEVPE